MKKYLCNNRDDEDDEPKTISNRDSNSRIKKERHYCELDENGEMICRKLTSYECKLEDDVEQLQDALFRITSHYAKIQFRLRQIATASGCERLCLLKELERMTSQDLDNCKNKDIGSEMPSLESDSQSLGNVRVKQHKILTQLRGRLQNLAEAAGTCFQTESGACYNLNRCACQKIKKGVEINKLPIFDDNGNLIETHDQNCHCCNCIARLDQQGKGMPQAGTPVENKKSPLSSRRTLSETWSDTDYGKADMEKAILKTNSKKSKKSKSGKKKSRSRSRKPHFVDYGECGSAGDLKSQRISNQLAIRKAHKYSPDDYGSAGDLYTRSRAKNRSTHRNLDNGRTSSRTPSCTSHRTPSKSSGQIRSRKVPRSYKEFNNTDDHPVKASSSPRLTGECQCSLLPDSTKSETNQSSRQNPQRQRLFIRHRSDSQGAEGRHRCTVVCRANRMCQRANSYTKDDIFANKGRREKQRVNPNHYESETEQSEYRSSSSKSQIRDRQYNGKNDKSQRHLFDQILGENPRCKTNQSSNNYNEENKMENQNQSQSHGISCTCCSCSRRLGQDFGIRKQSVNNNTNQHIQNKPVIVVKSDIWIDEKSKNNTKDK